MKKKLEGYICPKCRLLFSLPVELAGNGVHCPGCNELLTIPSVEDGVLIQGGDKHSYQQAGFTRQEISENEAYKEGQWLETRKAEISQEEESDKALRWMLPIGITALLLLSGVVYFVMSAIYGDEAPSKGAVAIVSNDGQAEENVAVFDAQSNQGKEKLKAFLDQLYAIDKVSELIPFCRTSKNLKTKMLKFYKGEEIPEKKLKNLKRVQGYGGVLGFYSYIAETIDYESEVGFVEYKDGEFKLDWEGSVGFSEMTWEEMKKERPTEPVTLRVIMKRAEYYNLAFKDEKKWLSLAISNPNEKSGDLYAYVRRKSAAEHQVNRFGLTRDGRAVILKAHYPKNSESDNQVIISEVVEDYWIKR